MLITKEGMKPFTIEHFFTKRKVEDQQEYISEKSMERKTDYLLYSYTVDLEVDAQTGKKVCLITKFIELYS